VPAATIGAARTCATTTGCAAGVGAGVAAARSP
jgi:hypothetical protein